MAHDIIQGCGEPRTAALDPVSPGSHTQSEADDRVSLYLLHLHYKPH